MPTSSPIHQLPSSRPTTVARIRKGIGLLRVSSTERKPNRVCRLLAAWDGTDAHRFECRASADIRGRPGVIDVARGLILSPRLFDERCR